MSKKAPLFLAITAAVVVIASAVAGIMLTRNNLLKSGGSLDDGYSTASETVREYYNAIGAEHYEKAKALLAGSALEEFDKYCYSTSDAPVTAISFILTEEGADTATICVDEQLTGFDTTTKMMQVTYNLELRNGVWKIVSIIYSEEEV
ncbi:MAG: hypothetical protein PHV32_09240 [Eubacteriales bacterium]|nr:hypothetical protein [Eubacteriales bacterium]